MESILYQRPFLFADAAGGLYDTEEETETEDEDERRKVTEFDSSFTDVEGETRAKKSDDDLVRICVAINSNTTLM